MRNHIVLLLTGLLVSSYAYADEAYDMSINCDFPAQLEDSDRTQCAGREMEEGAARLEKTYRQLLKETSEKSGKDAIIASQAAWKEFAEKQCTAWSELNGIDPSDPSYGEVMNGCLNYQNEMRTRELAGMIRVLYRQSTD